MAPRWPLVSFEKRASALFFRCCTYSGRKRGEIANEGDGNDISILLSSNRLQITVDIDDKGLEKLEQMLAKYKEILKILQ